MGRVMGSLLRRHPQVYLLGYEMYLFKLWCTCFLIFALTMIASDVFLFVTRCFYQKLANCWGMKDSDESLWALASMRTGHDVYGVVYEEMCA